MTDSKHFTPVPRHRPVGSQWGKWDLHFHTPSSFDYHDKSVSDQQIIEGLGKNGIDVVAITDHHFIDVQRIKNLQQLAGESLSVLPGIEFRTDLGGKETVHLIGIFPENCDLEVVKSDRPEDLIFQSVRTGVSMRDNNILSRHIKPAARKLGLPWINWRCLRTSHATWMVEAGANPKDVQGQMRHSRISTTMDIYAQFVPESQRRALAKMSAMVEARTSKPVAATGSISMQPQSRTVN